MFKNLEGDWVLNREIYNIKTGKTELAKGNAVFCGIQNLHNSNRVLEYQETGMLKLTDIKKPLKFSKSYTYKCSDDEIKIYFNDGVSKGKLFQKLKIPNSKTQRLLVGAKHVCNLDTYRGEYCFTSSEEFKITFNVEGPHKKFKIVTTYRRN